MKLMSAGKWVLYQRYPVIQHFNVMPIFLPLPLAAAGVANKTTIILPKEQKKKGRKKNKGKRREDFLGERKTIYV